MGMSLYLSPSPSGTVPPSGPAGRIPGPEGGREEHQVRRDSPGLPGRDCGHDVSASGGQAPWGRGSGPPSPHAPPSPPRKMQHKNLVRLLGVILHQGLYIVMEHVSKVRRCTRAGRWGAAGNPRTPARVLSTGQPGELPADSGPGPREHTPAPAVFPVSGGAPWGQGGAFQGQGETEAQSREEPGLGSLRPGH